MRKIKISVIRHASSCRDSRSHATTRVIRRKTNRRHMTGDPHGQTAGMVTLLVRALDGLLDPVNPAPARQYRPVGVCPDEAAPLRGTAGSASALGSASGGRPSARRAITRRTRVTMAHASRRPARRTAADIIQAPPGQGEPSCPQRIRRRSRRCMPAAETGDRGRPKGSMNSAHGPVAAGTVPSRSLML